MKLDVTDSSQAPLENILFYLENKIIFCKTILVKNITSINRKGVQKLI